MLRFIQKRDRYGFPEKAHITDGTGKCLCGADASGTLLHPADWDAVHYRIPHPGVCKGCRQAAILRLRPKAVFWYSDPFNGDTKEFPSLRAAVSSARKEHGNPCIWQVGPGDVNKIVKVVEGLPALP